MEAIIVIPAINSKTTRFENKAAHSGNLRFKQGRDRDEGKKSVDKSE